MAQSGYPWTLDLLVVYDCRADGLTVTQTATNLAADAGAVRPAVRTPTSPSARGPATAGS